MHIAQVPGATNPGSHDCSRRELTPSYLAFARCSNLGSPGSWSPPPYQTKWPTTFAASPFDLAGGLGWRALRRCAPRWGRCRCALLRASARYRETATSHIAAAMCSNPGCLGSPSSPRAHKNEKARARRAHSFLAGGLGFEPRLTESESVVLPLDDPPKEPLRGFPRAAP